MSRRAGLVLAVAFAGLLPACAAAEPGLGGGVALGAVAADSSPTDTLVTAAAVPGAVSVVRGSLPSQSGVAVVAAGGAPLAVSRGGDVVVHAHQGLVMGFVARSGPWLQVVGTCDEPLWVHEDDVEVTRAALRHAPGAEFDLSEAVIVLDPGHGDRDWGGVGPTGLAEKAVNLDIAERVRGLMRTSHDIDWATGAISDGSAVSRLGKVWLTRDRSGPNGGDIELGLGFRAEFANAAGADVLVSIHNNTVPRISTDIPGTEVFYSLGVPGSDRLAGLIYEELLRSFTPFSASWMGGELLGARGRFDPATDDDYYGLLRRAQMPAVIVEGIYISEAEEETLLAQAEFRQAYAEGVYRGILRFLTTGESGTVHAPEPFTDDAGTVNTSVCVIPEQQ